MQEAAKQVPGLKREQVFAGIRTPALGGDLTSVKCQGQWLPLGISVDPLTGLTLSVNALSAEDTQTLKAWIEPIAHSVGAQFLVTDDADGFKTIVDEIGVQHQVCKSHVLRNSESLIERFQALLKAGEDASLPMRGYKAPENAVRVSRFLAWCGNFLNRGGADLAMFFT